VKFGKKLNSNSKQSINYNFFHYFFKIQKYQNISLLALLLQSIPLAPLGQGEKAIPSAKQTPLGQGEKQNLWEQTPLLLLLPPTLLGEGVQSLAPLSSLGSWGEERRKGWHGEECFGVFESFFQGK
jgi:hypothetical protein